jgi:hypothetical protein
MSIGVLLTPQQLSNKHRLLETARLAKAAGQAVRWQYDKLFIDGKQYTGPGSLPTPAEQQAASKQPARTHDAEDGWQVVQPKKGKLQQPAKAAGNRPNVSKGAAASGSKRHCVDASRRSLFKFLASHARKPLLTFHKAAP